MKLPVLSFEESFLLVKESQIKDNRYGAAATILKRHQNELLETCSELFQIRNEAFKHKHLIEIFRLDIPYKRSETKENNYEEIGEAFAKWKLLADLVKPYQK